MRISLYLAMFVILSTGVCLSQNVNAAEMRISTNLVPISERTIPLVRQAYGLLGYEIKVEDYPLVRALSLANNGDTDAELIRVPEITQDYPNLIRIPTPITRMKLVAVTRSNYRRKPRTWSDLKNTHFAIVRGVKALHLRTAHMAPALVTSPDSLIHMLTDERIDIAIMLESMLEQVEMQTQGLTISNPPLEQIDLFHFVHKKHSHMVDDLDRAFQNILKQQRAVQVP